MRGYDLLDTADDEGSIEILDEVERATVGGRCELPPSLASALRGQVSNCHRIGTACELPNRQRAGGSPRNTDKRGVEISSLSF